LVDEAAKRLDRVLIPEFAGQLSDVEQPQDEIVNPGPPTLQPSARFELSTGPRWDADHVFFEALLQPRACQAVPSRPVDAVQAGP
jgi:hypothetical protein